MKKKKNLIWVEKNRMVFGFWFLRPLWNNQKSIILVSEVKTILFPSSTLCLWFEGEGEIGN